MHTDDKARMAGEPGLSEFQQGRSNGDDGLHCRQPAVMLKRASQVQKESP